MSTFVNHFTRGVVRDSNYDLRTGSDDLFSLTSPKRSLGELPLWDTMGDSQAPLRKLGGLSFA